MVLRYSCCQVNDTSHNKTEHQVHAYTVAVQIVIQNAPVAEKTDLSNVLNMTNAGVEHSIQI